jgi:hypothetical protein
MSTVLGPRLRVSPLFMRGEYIIVVYAPSLSF